MIRRFATIFGLCVLTALTIVLWKRFSRRKVMPVRRTDHAYSKERDYATTPRVPTQGPASIDAHEFLDYARFRAEVAAFVMKELGGHPDMALVGFLTGSVGPLVTPRASTLAT
jgi:hypothetical protein